MRGSQIRGRNANCFRRQFGLVDAGRVIEYGRQTSIAHVAADPLDDLGWRERLAEDFDRPPAACVADDVTSRAKSLAQCGDCPPRIVAARIDPRHVQSWRRHSCHSDSSIPFRKDPTGSTWFGTWEWFPRERHSRRTGVLNLRPVFHSPHRSTSGPSASRRSRPTFVPPRASNSALIQAERGVVPPGPPPATRRPPRRHRTRQSRRNRPLDHDTLDLEAEATRAKS